MIIDEQWDFQPSQQSSGVMCMILRFVKKEGEDFTVLPTLKVTSAINSWKKDGLIISSVTSPSYTGKSIAFIGVELAPRNRKQNLTTPGLS
jgi:hypothetical protein